MSSFVLIEELGDLEIRERSLEHADGFDAIRLFAKVTTLATNNDALFVVVNIQSSTADAFGIDSIFYPRLAPYAFKDRGMAHAHLLRLVCANNVTPDIVFVVQ